MDIDEKEKRESISAEIMSVNISEEENELDPAKLHKAFKFAAWSSVILVSGQPSPRAPPRCCSQCML